MNDEICFCCYSVVLFLYIRTSSSSAVAVNVAEADAVVGSINLTELHDDGGRVELICKG